MLLSGVMPARVYSHAFVFEVKGLYDSVYMLEYAMVFIMTLLFCAFLNVAQATDLQENELASVRPVQKNERQGASSPKLRNIVTPTVSGWMLFKARSYIAPTPPVNPARRLTQEELYKVMCHSH